MTTTDYYEQWIKQKSELDEEQPYLPTMEPKIDVEALKSSLQEDNKRLWELLKKDQR